MTVTEGETAILREFYDSWVAFHKVRNEPTGTPTWDRARLELAASALSTAASKVERFDKAH